VDKFAKFFKISYFLPDKKVFRYVLFIFIAALGVRLFIFGILFFRLGEWSGLAWVDASNYMALAKNLSLGNGFSLSDSLPFEPHTLRTPGYPIFLSVFYYLFGVYWPASLFEAVLNSFVPVFIFWLAFKLTDNLKTSAVAGFLTAFDYHIAVHTLTLNTESIFVFITVLAVVLIYQYIETPSFKKAAVIGLLSGFAALTRPFFYYAFPLIFIFLLLDSIRRRAVILSASEGSISVFSGLRDRFFALLRMTAPAFCFLFIALALVIPWMYRNKQVSGQFTLSTLGWYNMYTRMAAMVNATVSQKSYIQSLEDLMNQLKNEGHISRADEHELFDVKFIPLLRERTLEILKAHPKETVLVQLNSVQTLFTQDDLLYILNHSQLLPDAVRPPIPLSLLLLQKGPSAWRDMLPYLKGQYLIPYIMRVVWLVFWVLSIFGAWVLVHPVRSPAKSIFEMKPEGEAGLRLPSSLNYAQPPTSNGASKKAMVYFLIALIFLTVLVSLPVSASLNARYRVPFAPFYFIFVAAGIYDVFQRIRFFWSKFV